MFRALCTLRLGLIKMAILQNFKVTKVPLPTKMDLARMSIESVLL